MAENGLICPTCGKSWPNGRFCPEDGGKLEAVAVPAQSVNGATECFDALEIDAPAQGDAKRSEQPVPQHPSASAGPSEQAEPNESAEPKVAASAKVRMEWPALRESGIQAALAEARNQSADNLDATVYERAVVEEAKGPLRRLVPGMGAPTSSHDDTSATVQEVPAIRPAGSTSARMYARARQGANRSDPDTVQTVLDTPAIRTDFALELEGVVSAEPEAPQKQHAPAETEFQTSQVPTADKKEDDVPASEDDEHFRRSFWERLMFWRRRDWSEFD